MLQLCGWNIQYKKTSTEVVQSLLHLGFVTDSVQMRYFLPVEKEKVVVEQLQKIVKQASDGHRVASLELAKLLGKLNSMRRPHGQVLGVLSRTCQHLLGVKVNSDGWHLEVQLTYEAVRELKMLEDRIESLNGQHIFTAEAKAKIFELSETERLTELIKSTDEQLSNLFVSDASDSHVLYTELMASFSWFESLSLAKKKVQLAPDLESF